MVDKVLCPHCHKFNDIHKFCVYCGKKLPLDDDQIRLMTAKPKVRCLNCGRPVGDGQTKCECGYEFEDINCPYCKAINSYANRFCVSCGKKLWKADVDDYSYNESLFKPYLIVEKFPLGLRNISLYKRYKLDCGISFPGDISRMGTSAEKLQSEILQMDRNLEEIASRWKIVSPDYCINCLEIIKPEDSYCIKCGSRLLGDGKRVEYLQTEKNNYINPPFDRAELKWTSKYSEHYVDSLAPSMWESQLEYRERLKWAFAENVYHKKSIKKKISLLNAPKPVVKPKPAAKPNPAAKPKVDEVKTRSGGYCDVNCRHCYEELLDSYGGIVGDYVDGGYIEYYCHLGHSLSFGSFCEDYQRF